MKKLIKDFAKVAVIGAVSIIGYIIIKQMIYTPVVPSNKEDICSQYDGKGSELPVGLIHDMVTNYKKRNRAENKYMSLDRDSESIWFDLETLKKFLYHVEFASKNDKNPGGSKDLGIRIYYARYPDRSEWTNTDKYKNALDDFYLDPEAKDYGGKHTLVMVPTIRLKTDLGNINADFNPLDTDSYINGLKSMPKYNNTSEHPMLTLNFIPKKRLSVDQWTTSAQNHGSLIPPRKPGMNELGF